MQRTIAKRPATNAKRPAAKRPASENIVEETDKTGILEVATTNKTGGEVATTDKTGTADEVATDKTGGEVATDKTGIAGDPDKTGATKFDDTDSDMYWSPHAPDW